MINLFLEYWHCSCDKRNKEVQDCILTNANSGIFENIFIYSENSVILELFKHKNIKPILGSTRCTFYIGFEFLNNFIKCNKLQESKIINVVTNADIEFNETIKLTSLMKENDFYALTRYELNVENKSWELHKAHDPLHGSDSQDVWIYKGLFNLNGNFKIPFGVPGCDNKVAYEIYNNKYNLLNPCLDIIVLHRHQTDSRPGSSSDTKQRVSGPYYLINPSKITDNSRILEGSYLDQSKNIIKKIYKERV